ncbi:MAG: hypothetical protein LBB21_03495 [Holosporaceae bacterium]|nr:hypothetical protein [Holosporaceae bacterium]
MTDKDKFLRRMFIYNLQYVLAAIFAVVGFFGIGFVFFSLCGKDLNKDLGVYVFFLGIQLSFSVFNTVTFFYSQYLAKRYGVEMFADLDQDWLREHQAFDAKAFGEIFARLIHCRKIAGPYTLALIFPVALINMLLADIVGCICLLVYNFYYCPIYMDIAISYKVPRAFGGGGTVISKIIDHEFNDKLDKLTKKLDQKNKD